MSSREEVLAAIGAYFDGPPFDVAERQKYRGLGYSINEPAPYPAILPQHEWRPDSFVAIKGKEAVISLIRAYKPGNGAWTRLLKRLRDNGYKTTIVAPLPRFEAHLKRIGFEGPLIAGTTFEDRYDYYIDPSPHPIEGE